MATARTTSVAALVAVPPPFDGMTIATQHAVDVLHTRLGATRFTISANDGQSTWSWRVERQLRFFLLTLLLPWLRVRGLRVLYLVSDSRWGLPRVLLQVLVARVLGIRVILHHQVARYIHRRTPLMAAIVRAGGRSVTHLLLCARLRDRFRCLYGNPRTEILHNDFVLDEPRTATTQKSRIEHDGPSRDPVVMGMLSNLTVDKGVDTFCNIAKEILDAGYPVEILFAGPFSDAASEHAVRTLQHAHPGSVDYLGPVYDDDKWRFFEQLDLFVFPTRYGNEAEPVVVFEAMRAGLPVAALDRACIEEQIGTAGWVARDARELREVLLAVAAEGAPALQPKVRNLSSALSRHRVWADELIRIVHQRGAAVESHR